MLSLESSTIIDHTTVNCATNHMHKLEANAISGTDHNFTIKLTFVIILFFLKVPLLITTRNQTSFRPHILVETQINLS